MRYFLQLCFGLSLSIVAFIAPSTSLAQALKSSPDSPLELRSLRIAQTPVLVEVADTNRSRQTGLMHRQFMAEHRGMLFVFSEPQALCFWMRNTLIPLSIAYIDEHAKVIDIFDMTPLDERSICSSAPAQFALEVNQGWFERNHIKVGDLLQDGQSHDTEEAEKALQQRQTQ